MRIDELKSRIKDLRQQYKATDQAGETTKAIEEALVDDVTYLRSLEENEAEKKAADKKTAPEKKKSKK